MRVVFWGTPDFATPSLRALLDSPHQVAAVVTQPDRPAGRGRKLRASPIKRLALERDLPVLQPEKARGIEFMAELRALDPEISVVVAYGQILATEVLELPSRGSYNVHASLLPELRGAAPINWAIMNGHEETGITIMRMAEKMDAGPIVLQARCAIGRHETAGELSERLSRLGAEALTDALELIEDGRAEEREQDDSQATFAPKLDSDSARIDWSRSADEVDRLMRGADPWPAAWSELGGLRVKLFKPNPGEGAAGAPPGTVLRADPRRGLEVASGGGSIRIGEVQPAGKRRMDAARWIQGRGIEPGQVLE